MAVRKYLTDAEDVAEVARAQRAALCLTQQQVADKAGVSRSLVADIESGHPGAELGRVLRVLQALDIRALALPALPRPDDIDDIDDIDLKDHLDRYQRERGTHV